MAANITNLLVQINASANFLLYSMASSKFRRVFCRTLCPASKGGAAMALTRTSTCKQDIPLASHASMTTRHREDSEASSPRIHLRASLRQNDYDHNHHHHHHPQQQMRLLLKPGVKRSEAENGGARSWLGDRADWHRRNDYDCTCSTTDTVYTDSDRDV